MRLHTVLLAAAAILALATPSALAQESPRSAVSFASGIGTGASDVGPALGGTFLFDLTERFAIEGQGTFLSRSGGDDLTLGASLLVNLLGSRRAVAPYAAVGGGLYRASYDLDNPRFLGAPGPQFPAGSMWCTAPGQGFVSGPQFGPHMGAAFMPGACPADAAGYWGTGEMPRFYARRLGPMAFPGSGGWDIRHFTDPAVSVGGGIRIDIANHLELRPDLRAVMALADGDTHTRGVFVLNLGYRF